MSENLKMIFTLSAEEMVFLWLDLTEEERIATVKSDLDMKTMVVYPYKWNERVFETIKSCLMIDLERTKTVKIADIDYATFVNYQKLYGRFSEKFKQLVEIREDNVLTIAKTQMMALVLNWDRRAIQKYVETKDKRYRPNEVSSQESVSKILWLAKTTKEEVVDFISARKNRWLNTEQSPQKTSQEQKWLPNNAE